MTQQRVYEDMPIAALSTRQTQVSPIRDLGLSVVLCLAACILPLFFSSPCAAGTEQDTATLRIGTFDLPPWGWKDPDSHMHGIIFDLHQNIAQRTGLAFTNEIYPYSRLADMLRSGQLDVISGQPHKILLEAGEQLVLLHTINIIAVTRKGSTIRTIEGLRGKTLVYQNVASYPQLEGIAGNIIRVNGYEQAVRVLHKRTEVDAAVFSEPSFYYFMNLLGLSRNDFGPVIPIERNREDWIFVRHGLARNIKDALIKATEDATREGVYNALLKRYCLMDAPD